MISTIECCHSDSINCLTFTPDSKYIISGSEDTTIKVWDIDQRKLLFTYYNHKSRIICLAVSPDNNTVASGSLENNFHIW